MIVVKGSSRFLEAAGRVFYKGCTRDGGWEEMQEMIVEIRRIILSATRKVCSANYGSKAREEDVDQQCFPFRSSFDFVGG